MRRCKSKLYLWFFVSGLALLSLSGEESRLQGLSTDLWTVAKGQKDLNLTRPKGTVPCKVSTDGEVDSVHRRSCCCCCCYPETTSPVTCTVSSSWDEARGFRGVNTEGAAGARLFIVPDQRHSCRSSTRPFITHPPWINPVMTRRNMPTNARLSPFVFASRSCRPRQTSAFLRA